MAALVSTVIADLRYGLRQLRRAPGFAITAVLTLALGIGATTAVYSVAYGVLIDPFPYHDVQTLATPKICVLDQPRCSWRIYTASQVAQIAQRTDIFTGVAVGLPLALAAGHFAQGQLIHTSQRDPLTLLVAICILPLLALTGTLLPARRATAINPTEALRAE